MTGDDAVAVAERDALGTTARIAVWPPEQPRRRPWPRSTRCWPRSTGRRAGSGPTRRSPGSTAPAAACSCSATAWPRPSASRWRRPGGPAGWPTRRSGNALIALGYDRDFAAIDPPGPTCLPQPSGHRAGRRSSSTGPAAAARRACGSIWAPRPRAWAPTAPCAGGHVRLPAGRRRAGQPRRRHGRRRDAAARRLAGHGGRAGPAGLGRAAGGPAAPRRDRDLVDHLPPVAARRPGTAPHRRSAHRAAGRRALADGERGRGDLRRRQRRRHRRHRGRGPGRGLARRGGPPGPAGRPGRPASAISAAGPRPTAASVPVPAGTHVYGGPGRSAEVHGERGGAPGPGPRACGLSRGAAGWRCWSRSAGHGAGRGDPAGLGAPALAALRRRRTAPDAGAVLRRVPGAARRDGDPGSVRHDRLGRHDAAVRLRVPRRWRSAWARWRSTWAAPCCSPAWSAAGWATAPGGRCTGWPILAWPVAFVHSLHGRRTDLRIWWVALIEWDRPPRSRPPSRPASCQAIRHPGRPASAGQLLTGPPREEHSGNARRDVSRPPGARRRPAAHAAAPPAARGFAHGPASLARAPGPVRAGARAAQPEQAAPGR